MQNKTSVKTVYDSLVECLPYGVIQLANSAISGNRRYDNKVPPIKAKPAETKEGMMLFCAFIINPYILKTYQIFRLSKITKQDDRKILDLFFGNRIMYFNTPVERTVPNSIQLWLKRFTIAEKYFVPLLQINETKKKDG